MSILKVNTALFFVLTLTISGGVFTKKLLTPHPRFHPLLSKSLKQYPGLKFHPHSEHYIYKEDTVEMSDKSEFKALASKLSQLPSNFPSAIILATVPASFVVSASSVDSPEVLNQGELITNRELYLISKYWLQLLPQFHPELLKCLAGPVAKPTSTGEIYPSNCPSTLKWLKDQTQTTQATSNSSSSNQSSENFSLPSALYTKLYRCPNANTQCQHKNCYCEEKSCTNCSNINCKCYSQSDLTIGPRFFTPETFSSKFSYPSPSHFTDKLQTFNATDPISKTSQPTSTSLQTNHLRLPPFSFPLPHFSYTNPQTQNSIVASETASLLNSMHWPQSNEINTNFSIKVGSSLDVLVSKLLSSPTSFHSNINNSQTTTLTKNSPTQLFFVRYLATLYALLWSYSPDNFPLFPSNYNLTLFHSNTTSEPLFNTLPTSNPTVSQK